MDLANIFVPFAPFCGIGGSERAVSIPLLINKIFGKWDAVLAESEIMAGLYPASPRASAHKENRRGKLNRTSNVHEEC